MRQQLGSSALQHSPRTMSTGSNAESHKLPKLASEGEEPSQPVRRNRRRRKPAPPNPGARGARSMTVGLGPGDASRQGAGERWSQMLRRLPPETVPTARRLLLVGSLVLAPRLILAWTTRTPSWSGCPGMSRVVLPPLQLRTTFACRTATT